VTGDGPNPAAVAPPEAGASDGPTVAAATGPRSCGELFWVFNRLALQGFGGVLAVAQRELVERKKWISREDFVEFLSVGQVLPGPNVVNLALLLGDRWFGWRGALSALAGMIAIPLVIVLALAALYNSFASHPVVAGALRGMGAVAAGLVFGTALKLAPALTSSRLGIPAVAVFALVPFVAIGVFRLPLLWVVLGVGLPAIALAWRQWGR
jgi:chromate transporter